jgi:cholesterol transport system auxiliary component
MMVRITRVGARWAEVASRTCSWLPGRSCLRMQLRWRSRLDSRGSDDCHQAKRAARCHVGSQTMRSTGLIGVLMAAGFLTLAASGCAGLSKPYPARQFHILRATPPAEDASADPMARASDAVLRVRTARVTPPFEAQGLVYRLGETRFERDFYQQFLSRPHELITGEITRGLRERRVCGTILDGLSGGDAPFVLETVVTDLYGDRRGADGAHAILAVEFFLLLEEPERTRVIFEHTYRWEEPLDESSTPGGRDRRDGDNPHSANPGVALRPADLVAGWNRALGHVLDELAADLRDVKKLHGSE